MSSLIRFLVFVLFVAACVAGLYFWRQAQPVAASIPSQQQQPSTIAEAKPSPVPQQSPPSTPAKEEQEAISSLETLDREFQRVVGKVLPSVVSIDGLPPGSSRQKNLMQMMLGTSDVPVMQMGSGVILTSDGYVLTNLHVVQGSGSVRVNLSDGRQFDATLVGSDAGTDIAILKIDAENLTPAKLADSDKVEPGQIVFAIGNPFGLQETVTQGIISAKGRRGSSEMTNEYIQTDADINQGNSGGPLINVRGEVVGINNFILSGNGGSLGIGFAIPSNVARKVFEDVLNYGRVRRPFLGVSMLGQKITPQIAKRLNIPDSGGALIMDVVPGSPASEAGLQTGDVVTEYNNKRIQDHVDLQNRVRESTPGHEVPVRIYRDGKEMIVNVHIREEPREASVVSLPVRPPEMRGPLDGIIAEDLTPETARLHGIPPGLGGVRIKGFQNKNASPAARYLRENDVILQVGNRDIKRVEDLKAASEELQRGHVHSAVVVRGRMRYLVPLYVE